MLRERRKGMTIVKGMIIRFEGRLTNKIRYTVEGFISGPNIMSNCEMSIGVQVVTLLMTSNDNFKAILQPWIVDLKHLLVCLR